MAGTKDNAPPVHLLVASALEAWCHHLLYVRRVYPQDSFGNNYFLGIRCKVNRHPGVVEYISKAVQVAVPALISTNRVADEFSLEVVDDQVEPSIYAVNTRMEFTRKIHAQYHDSSTPGEQSTTSTASRKRKLPHYDMSLVPVDNAEQKNNTLPLPSSTSPSSKKSAQNSQSDQDHSTQQSSASMASSSASQYQFLRPHSRVNDDDSQERDQTNDSAIHSLFENRSLKVMEKFSLTFSSPLEQTTDEKMNNSESNQGNRRRPSASRFNMNHRKVSRSNQQQSKKLQAKDLLEEQQTRTLEALERGFRNLILNLSNLQRNRIPPSDNLTFKVVLHTMEDDGRQAICQSVEAALENGNWYPSSAETAALSKERRPTLPLYHVVVDDCDIRFSMLRRIKES